MGGRTVVWAEFDDVHRPNRSLRRIYTFEKESFVDGELLAVFDALRFSGAQGENYLALTRYSTLAWYIGRVRAISSCEIEKWAIGVDTHAMWSLPTEGERQSEIVSWSSFLN